MPTEQNGPRCRPAPARSTLLLLAVALPWLLPAPAWAVQVHGGAEGYIVHQMAHIFLGAALLFLLLVLHRRPPGTGKPWRHLKLSLLLFLLWDIDTTLVHWLANRLPEHALLTTVGPSLVGDRILLPDSWVWYLYYAGSHDHLLCVPAIWFLVLSLKGLGASAASGGQQTSTAP
ncbi:MAG: hypothetical protein AB1413_11605 [Thermodesulfobacteriota bacterium]